MLSDDFTETTPFGPSQDIDGAWNAHIRARSWNGALRVLQRAASGELFLVVPRLPGPGARIRVYLSFPDETTLQLFGTVDIDPGASATTIRGPVGRVTLRVPDAAMLAAEGLATAEELGFPLDLPSPARAILADGTREYALQPRRRRNSL